MVSRNQSIQGRMLLWVLSVTGLILAAVIFWSYLAARHRLEQDIQNKTQFLVEGAARQVDAHLGPLQGTVRGVADALEAQQGSFTFSEIRAMQTSILQKNPGILGMAVAFDPGMAPEGWQEYAAWAFREGDRLFYEDLSGEAFMHTLEDWFMLPKYLDKPVWSEPYDWEGLLMVTYSVPFYRIDEQGKRQFVGVVTCDLSLEFLNQLLSDLPLNQNDYAMLMSRNGTFVAHPDETVVLNESMFSLAQDRVFPEMRRIGQSMVSGETGIADFTSFVTRELSWLAYTPLDSSDWIMAVMVSRKEMQQAILRLSRRQLTIGVVGMWLLFFAIAVIARSITRPIKRLEVAADALAAGNMEATLPVPRGNDEVARLTHSFTVMRDNLLKYMADLEETTAARERMHSELRIAHDIQMSLVPKTFPPIPSRNDLDLFAALEPAREVGGDFYDFFALDEKRLVLAIGDVSGKGVPAALFMAVTRSFLRSAFRSETDTSAVLNHVNRELVEGNESCMFVTLFCAVLDLDAERLEYVNAGHNPPLIRYPNGKTEWVSEPKGPIAGVMEEMDYPSGQISLPEGAILLFYTDGVTEAMDEAQALYGEERLETWFRGIDPDMSCQALTGAMLEEIRAFAGNAEQSDDITLLMVRKLSGLGSESRVSGSATADQEAVEQKVGDQADPGKTEGTTEGTTDVPVFKRQFRAEWSEMESVLDQIEQYLEQHGIVDGRVFKARLALEELLTNTIKYGCTDASRPQDSPCEIRVELSLQTPLQLVIEDTAAPFDPNRDAPAPTLDADIEDRKIGGLGLHMLKEMGMTLDYRYEDNCNYLRVTFPE
jgi:sigma-B regulation protein RsbU (phosphoserine phosphatase)